MCTYFNNHVVVFSANQRLKLIAQVYLNIINQVKNLKIVKLMNNYIKKY